MIWLTWRQHRKRALFTLIGLAVLAALMVPTGRTMHRAFDDNGLPECLRSIGHAAFVSNTTQTCSAAFDQFNSRFKALEPVGVLFLFLPLLVGCSGAPHRWRVTSSRGPTGWCGHRV